eukprot:3047667-Amphidinium_carterae.2
MAEHKHGEGIALTEVGRVECNIRLICGRLGTCSAKVAKVLLAAKDDAAVALQTALEAGYASFNHCLSP